MAGKRTIDPKLHARVRRLRRQRMSRRAIAEQLDCSLYTVRVALDPKHRAREAARQREHYPDRHADRLARDPGYAVYRAAYFATPDYRARVRGRMRALRALRRQITGEAFAQP